MVNCPESKRDAKEPISAALGADPIKLTQPDLLNPLCPSHGRQSKEILDLTHLIAFQLITVDSSLP